MTKEFGDRFLRYMERADFSSQRKLAQEAFVSKTTIQHIVKGERGASSEMATKLMKTLRIPRENRAEFLLFAAGYTREQVEDAIGREVVDVSEIKPMVKKEIKDSKGKVVGILRY